MSTIQALWNKVSRYGIAEDIPYEEQGRIILTNQICSSTGILVMVFTLISWKDNILLGNLIQLFSFFMFILIIFLNHLKKYLLGKLLLTLSVTLVIFVNGSIMGFESGEALGFIPVFIGTYILYDLKNKWVNAYAFGVPFLFLVLLEITDYSYLKNNPISPKVLYFIFWYNYGVSLLICMLIALYFKREARRQHEFIIRSEKELQKEKEKESATEIRQKQMALLAVVTSLDDIIFEVDENYIFLNVWTKDESKLFMPKEKFLGKSMGIVFGDEFCIPFQNAIDKVLLTKQSQSMEYPSLTEEGIWYEATVNSINSMEEGWRKVSLIIKDISARKKEEKTARDNFELFSLVAENIPVGMIISRVKDGVIIYTNDALATMNKMKKEDFVNITSVQLYKNPEDRTRFLDLIKKNGSVLNFETVGILGDGTEAPGLLSGTISTYLGEPVFIGLVLDITELKKAQEEVKQKEEIKRTMQANIEALVNNTNDPIFSIDTQYRITVMNDACKEMFMNSYGEERNVGEEVFIQNDDLQKNYWKALYDRCFEGERFSDEISVVLQDEIKSYSFSLNPIKGKNNEITGISCMGRDITEMLRVNEEKRKTNELVYLMEANLKALINNTTDLIFSIDHEYKITVINDSCIHFFKEIYKEERKIGDLVFISHENSEDRNMQIDYWKELYDKALKGEQFNIELEFYVNKENKYYEISFSPIQEIIGKIKGISCIGHDVTDRKKAQEEKIANEFLIIETNKRLTEHRLSALRSQMNPHFIFNALNSIQQRILSGKKEEAYQYLTEFSKLIRIILDKSDKLFIPLDEEIESLQLYLKLEAMRLGNSFEYTIDIAPDIYPEDIDFPSLILQPFVENAIWHGLMHKEDNRILQVEIKKNKTELQCSITDNGVGRKKASEIKQKNDNLRKSKGLTLISERLNLLNTIHPGQTEFSFHDLYDEKKIASGTRVEIIIQLHEYERH